MTEEPIKVLPWGRTKEQDDALQAKKAQGRAGVKGCLVYALILTVIIVYCAGWLAGKHS